MSWSVKNFYDGQNVLITGGTGYLGKLLTAKLLATTNVKMIYLIVRLKEGADAQQRTNELFDKVIFNKIDKNVFMDKVQSVEGDLMKPGLGMSHANKAFLRENINIIFHCAANMNMSAKLRTAVMTNVNGTTEILDIMKGAKVLKAFVAVSTAYSFCIHKIIEEKFYDSNMNGKLLLTMVRNMKPSLFDELSPQIMGNWPNSYVYTKAVAENVLQSEGEGIPLALFRPTIITSTVSEPAPGWFGNLYGPMELNFWCGSSVLTVFNGIPNNHIDTVPGDYVANAVICVACDVGKKWNENTKDFKIPVYNFGSYKSPLFVKLHDYLNLPVTCEYPPFERKLSTKPFLVIISNKFVFRIFNFLLHTFRGYLMDKFSIVTKKKTRMSKLYSRIFKLNSVLFYFTTCEWIVKNDNTKAVWNSMSREDQSIFPFDTNSVNTEEYYKNQMIGLKKYALHEDVKDLPKYKVGKSRINVSLILLMFIFFVVFLVIQNASKSE
ncbi:hypothetical protein GWI33_002786 [Rhynchophorus ferrugineus]|uniref:Fatty acyl-CoA reductase n=1 Tax=Rhynchophorus ferrugineus TaxID=354439 RepID=A0A834MJE6_RHYFE|nr:hypothetical protein GWI33_002786 [Rhynchophorus ferrugineus]